MSTPCGKFRVDDGRNYDIFRDRLKKLMKAYGYNMKDLSIAIDLNPTSISRYFQDRGPDTIALWRIADKFGVSIDWLLGRTDEQSGSFSDEAAKVARLYDAANADDKLVVDTLLKRYDL